MITYRLRHIPTGLYYRPSGEVKFKMGNIQLYIKTNLSKKGKVYSSKPSLSWIKHGFYNHVQFKYDRMIEMLTDGKIDSFVSKKKCLYPYVESDWIIEES